MYLGKLPDGVVACVGGGSNAIGMFHPFVNDKSVKLVGCEAGGEGNKNYKFILFLLPIIFYDHFIFFTFL